MVSRKAQIVNVLTISIAVLLLVIGVYAVLFNPDITGFATKVKASDKIDADVADAINEEGEAEVIVILKSTAAEVSSSSTTLDDKKEAFEDKKERILENIEFTSLENVTETEKIADVSVPDTEELILNHEYSNVGAFSGKVTKEGLQKLKNDPNVEKIVFDSPVQAFLTNTVPHVQADAARGIQTNGINITGSGQSVCVIDTGVDYTHESLGGCSLTNVSEHTCKVITGYDFVNLDANPIDDQGHGTHVAGIVAGNGAVRGVATGARIVAIKALNAAGSGVTSDVIAGIDWCVNNATQFNISVITMSLGSAEVYTQSTCPTTYDSSVQAATAAGLTVFAASGNSNSQAGIAEPSCSPYLISVGNSRLNDSIYDAPGTGSNRHAILDIVAPGVSVVSTNLGGGTFTRTGTSMSTPHAAGVAAMVYQYEKLLNNRNATQRQVEALLKKSNTTVREGNNSYPRLNALQSLQNVFRLNTSANMVDAEGVAVQFNAANNIENASEAFTIGHNFISLNASRYPIYNTSANITFRNITFTYTPAIMRDNIVCADCSVLQYVGGVLQFTVSHFSNYTTGPNARLAIFDQADAEGGSISAHTSQQVFFFANYTNISSNLNISTATCDINFTDVSSTMAFNDTTALYTYNRTFTTSGTKEYNISCSAPLFEALNTSDSVFVSPACLEQTPNVNITINAGYISNCTAESISLINQSLFVYGSLFLNNSHIILESTGSSSNALFLLNESSLTVFNSTLNGSVNVFTLQIENNSNAIISSSRLLGVSLSTRGNATLNVSNSFFTEAIALGDNSTSRFSNSSFNTSAVGISTTAAAISTFIGSTITVPIQFGGSSISKVANATINNTSGVIQNAYVEIQNTTIDRIQPLGPASPATTVVINFTPPRSNITTNVSFRFNSTIYGYVDMPDNLGLFAITNIHRYYPVLVNYTNGTPIANRQVNVTNATGDVIFSGTTDANGIVFVNMNYTTATNGSLFNISVNPSEEAGLMTDTPIVFTLDIGNAPPTVVSLSINSTYATNFTTENITAYWNTTDSDGTRVANITDWRINGNSIAILNLAFENHSAAAFNTTDYSIYQRNGSVVGAQFNATGGYDGWGAYEFDGTGGIESQAQLPTGAQNKSVFVRFKTGAPQRGWIFSGGHSCSDGASFGLFVENPTEQRLMFFGCASSDFEILQPVIANKWYTVVITYDGSTTRAYVDGILNVSRTQTLSTSANSIFVGHRQGSPYGDSDDFEGFVDALMVFNRTLSAEQVRLLNASFASISSSETIAGENWSLALTPNDGVEDGTASVSNQITILNAFDVISAHPNASGELQGIADETNISVTRNVSTNTNLTFNITVAPVDAESSITFQWFVNGVLEFVETITSVFTSFFSRLFATPGDYNVTVVFNSSNDAVNDSFTFVMTGDNALPVTTNAFINTTFATNLTTENITAYWSAEDYNNHSIVNSTDWRINGNSIAVLNMPFEGGSNSTFTRDYSTQGNNGSVNGATYSDGKYQFDGTNDVIDVDGTQDLNFTLSQPFAMEAWVQPSLDAANRVIAGTGWDSSGYHLRITSANTARFILITDGTNYIFSDTSTISSGWNHLVATWDGSVARTYLNGVLDSSVSTSGTVTTIASSRNFTIGNIDGQSVYFNGNMSLVRIYNRSLSSEQITLLYQNTSHIVSSSETRKGENWTVAITPNDRFEDGLTIFSNDVMIQNTAPVLTNSFINTTFATNFTTENITAYWNASDIDDDFIVNITDWRVNGTSIASLNMQFEGGSNSTFTRDYTTFSNSGNVSGAVWNASAGYGSSGAYIFDGINDFIVINNSDSTNIAGDKISFGAWVYPYTNTNYQLIVGKLVPDAVSRHYAIYLVPGGTNQVYRSLGGDQGIKTLSSSWALNEWNHIFLTYNGSLVKIYLNGVEAHSEALTGFLSQSTTHTYIGSERGAFYQFNGSIDDVRIYNRSLSPEQVRLLYENKTHIISSAETNMGENWSVTVTPNDREIDGETIVSNSVIIFDDTNQVPIISNLSINTTFATNFTSENITAYWNVSDANNNAVVNITDWRVNGNSIAYLNYPMTNHSNAANNITDYSTHARNASLSGPVFCATCGHDGQGAYRFTTAGNIARTPLVVNEDAPFSFSFWINYTAASDAFTDPIGFEDGTGSEFRFERNGAGDDFYMAYLSTQCGSSFALSQNRWHHIYMDSNTTTYRLFVDGVFQTSCGDATGGTNAVNFMMGSIGFGRFFAGHLDDVFVFNRSLSPEQIILLNASRYNVISSQETITGENWSVAVTPNDGIEDGVTAFSNNITILANNFIPNATIAFPNATNETQGLDENTNNFSIITETGRNLTFNLTLEDTDADVLTFTWFVNGVQALVQTVTDVVANIFNEVFSYLFGTEGTFNITLIANDSVSNDTFTFFVTSNDTVAPSFNQTLTGFTVEYGHNISYDVNASDIVAIDSYASNDTTRFRMNATTGLLENNSLIPLGAYAVNITVNDTSNNINSTVITITSVDTTPPTWNETPTNQSLNIGNAFYYDVNASDLLFSTYRINDTIRFSINESTGVIRNATGISGGIYGLNISANDTSGNILSIIVNITIMDNPPILSGVAHSVTNETATITWSTNELANTTVRYGLSPSLGSISQVHQAVTSHSRILTGLTNNTLYYYNITSCDVTGNCVTNGTFNFTTSQNTAPSISSTPSSSPGSSSSSSSGSGYFCIPEYVCDDWSSCVNGVQTRTCGDSNGCQVSKKESQECSIVQEVKEPTQSGIIEQPRTEVPAPVAESIQRKSFFDILSEKYHYAILLLLSLFLLTAFIRRIETFPLVLWKDQHYLEQNNLEKAEKLYDKVIDRFSHSTTLEREYADKVKSLSLALDVAEHQRTAVVPASEQAPTVVNAVPEKTSDIANALGVKSTKYHEILKEYQKTYAAYLALPKEKRDSLEPALMSLRQRLLNETNRHIRREFR